MAKSSVMVSLPQMVDLALNCPEVGAVNFNILHSLLHVLIQQVDLLECKVEFRGNESERVQSVIAASKPGPTINLTEYIVTPGKDQRKVVHKKAKYKKVKGDKKGSKEEVIVEQELRVIEQRKDSKEEPVQHPPPMSSIDRLDSSSMQTVVVVEATDGTNTTTTPHVSVALSRVHFDNMEDELEKLKEEVRELKELPANMGLIEALRNSSVDKSSPVLDMFQILTLVKRVDATETGIGKLASMLEDLAREQATLVASGGRGRASKDVAKRASDLQLAVKDSKLGGLDGKDRIERLEKRVERLEKGGGGKVSEGTGGGTVGGGTAAGTDTGGEIKGVDAAEGATVTTEERGDGGGSVDEAVGEGGGRITVARVNVPVEERLSDLEIRFAEYTEQVSELDTVFNNQINVLQQQFTDLEKEIGEIVERIKAGMPGGDLGADQNISELYNKIVQLQEEMEQMTTTATKLLADKEERQQSMDAVLEQIEILKTIKANREDLEDALADKADACTVNRKVSHDQFDAACDDLAHGIEDALLKLTQQEQLWQQALDDIQREIENKLDKMELTPLRDFVHNKLKMLQERLKALAALKKETEAAGTKSRFLRNVNCISCDKDVIMRKQMDPSLLPPPPALPATKSIAPYLAYELDALRKQQKCMPHSRNMNHFESAMSGIKSKGGDEDHICNRYCGGSHTVTTPQQRVARLGHFLQQWGPETQPVNEGTIRGTDGQMYKAREGGDMTPGRPPLQQIEESENEYFPDMRARPSMVVHGGILATRSTMRSATSRISGEEQPSVIMKGPERKESQPPASPPQEQRASTANAQRKDSQRVSITAPPRASKDAGTSSKRASRASAGRASHSRGSVSKHASRVSIKETPEVVVVEGDEEAAPPTEGEAASPEEGEAAPAAEEEAAAEAPAEAEPAEEAAPAETESEPAPEAAPAEE